MSESEEPKALPFRRQVRLEYMPEGNDPQNHLPRRVDLYIDGDLVAEMCSREALLGENSILRLITLNVGGITIEDVLALEAQAQSFLDLPESMHPRDLLFCLCMIDGLKEMPKDLVEGFTRYANAAVDALYLGVACRQHRDVLIKAGINPDTGEKLPLAPNAGALADGSRDIAG